MSHDIDGIPFGFPQNVTNLPDCMIGCAGSVGICEQYEELKRKGAPIAPAMQALMKCIDEESNPVVVFAYVKR